MGPGRISQLAVLSGGREPGYGGRQRPSAWSASRIGWRGRRSQPLQPGTPGHQPRIAARLSQFHQPALAAITGAGLQCDAILTERQGQGAHLATTLAAGYDVVFTLGGDGTAMEVVGALAGSEGPPVGILPGGTGNLIARTLGIPLDVQLAVPLLLCAGNLSGWDLRGTGPEPPCRSPRRFAFAAGVGIDATMVAEVSARLKRHLGVPAYMLSWVTAALRRETFRARVTVDGEVVERDAPRRSCWPTSARCSTI